MKKLLAFSLCLVLICGLFASCSHASQNSAKKISIVATIFPEYDWVKTILGSNVGDADLTLLLDNGVDLHSYQPTADDLVKISTCDLFIYVGGESDEWVEDALAQSVNPNQIALNLLEVLGDAVKQEEVVEGMQGEEEESEEEEVEFDEHVWLSLKNTITLCNAIQQALSTLDADHSADYAQNCKNFTEELTALDAEYNSVIKGAKRNTILFADRFPFRYFADDYGLNYYAAFVGCSAETEAAFETIAFLAGKVQELDLPVILTLEGSDRKIAETVLSTAKSSAKILAMDSMQSTTSKNAEQGVTYLEVMKKNLQVLKEALY